MLLCVLARLLAPGIALASAADETDQIFVILCDGS
jgi:hypothetical protein